MQVGKNSLEIKIEGMHCEACAQRVERVLRSIEGVRRAAVSFEYSKARIEAVPGKVDVRQVEEAIERAGYMVVEDGTYIKTFGFKRSNTDS